MVSKSENVSRFKIAHIDVISVYFSAVCFWNSTCSRLRRIYFSDRLYSEEELPPEFKLFLPIQKQAGQAPQQGAASGGY